MPPSHSPSGQSSRCPTCGQAVRVESSDEGTAYYVGVEAERGRSGCPDGQCWASSLGEAVDHWKAEAERLRNVIEEYALWEPGRAGHAEAHRKLLTAARSTNA